MILIFSISKEFSTSNVINILKKRNLKVVRINRDDDTYKFIKVSKKEILFLNTITNESVNLLEATSCWWRREGLSSIHFGNKPKEIIIDNHNLTELIIGSKNLCDAEIKTLIDYIYRRIYNNCKINLGKPLFNMNRMITLDIAKKHGFKIPEFEIVKQLKKKSIKGDIISKTMDNGIYNIINHNRYYSYTEKIDKSFIKNSSETIFFPSLIMELVEKKAEIRSFFMIDHFYSMIIFSQKNKQTKIDFRKYDNIKPNKKEPFLIPREVEDKLKKIFKEFDLNCGSIDLIIDVNDEYVFLEINPVGQYGMTSEPCNYNLDYVISNYLEYGKIRID